jgi:hypothetical protein
MRKGDRLRSDRNRNRSLKGDLDTGISSSSVWVKVTLAQLPIDVEFDVELGLPLAARIGTGIVRHLQLSEDREPPRQGE